MTTSTEQELSSDICEQSSHALEAKNVPFTIKTDSRGIFVEFEGYGDCPGCDYPVMIEVWNGELRVVIWSDINKEDPTHIISLEGAHLSKLKEEEVDG